MDENAQDGPQVRIAGSPGETLPDPSRPGLITVEGLLRDYAVDPRGFESLRPGIFQDGQFSVFDALVAACRREGIPLQHHFDERLRTHLIDSLDGRPNWWYGAHYEGGHREEEPVQRMDTHLYRDRMRISVYPVAPQRVGELREAFGAEIGRLEENDGEVVVPEVTFRTLQQDLRFTNVRVRAHDLRTDIFRPGVVTAADVPLSLADAGLLSVEVEWLETIGDVRQQAYYFTVFNEERARYRAGFTYHVGEKRFRKEGFHGFGDNWIHVPADLRAIVSPEYMEWNWTDLSGRRGRRGKGC